MNCKSIRTLLTLMDGNIFWNIVAINLRCKPSPLKWFIISKGWQRNWDWVAWFRFSIETTSRLSEYECTLNVIVGPRGKRISRTCVDISDLENVTRWVTFSGPATLIKSFSTFFLLTCICTAYKNNNYINIKEEHDKCKINVHLWLARKYADHWHLCMFQQITKNVRFVAATINQIFQLVLCTRRQTFKCDAVYGSITCRISIVSLFTFLPTSPRWKTNEWGHFL